MRYSRGAPRESELIGLIALLTILFGVAAGQTPRPRFEAFEVATVKVSDESFPGRYIRMETDHRFVERNYTLKGLSLIHI